jgi:hypothetical protein
VKADIALFTATLLGVIAKELWDSLNTTGTVSISWSRFIGAIVISPIVFACVYQQLKRRTISIAILAIAFQNGFFWRAVLAQAEM